MSEFSGAWQVATGAVGGALVTFLAAAFIKRWDHRREDRKDEQKRNVVYLTIALELEDFAFSAARMLGQISEGIVRYRAGGEARFLESLEEPSFKFDPDIEWERVPASVAVRAKTFPRSFERSRDFVLAAWRLWAEVDDAWEYDAERLAFYGLGAIHFAAEIRKAIDVREDHLVAKVAALFEEHIESRRQFFTQARSEDAVIPELAEQFKRDGLRVST